VGLLLPGGEIDVGQRIELRDRDVDVADADAVESTVMRLPL